jgi:hypothetical protein
LTALAVLANFPRAMRRRHTIRRFGHMAPMRHAEGGFVYWFVSFDCHEPPHVHVRHRESEAKVWIRTAAPVRIPKNKSDLRKILAFVRRNQDRLLREWEEFCNGLG